MFKIWYTRWSLSCQLLEVQQTIVGVSMNNHWFFNKQSLKLQWSIFWGSRNNSWRFNRTIVQNKKNKQWLVTQRTILGGSLNNFLKMDNRRRYNKYFSKIFWRFNCHLLDRHRISTSHSETTTTLINFHSPFFKNWDVSRSIFDSVQFGPTHPRSLLFLITLNTITIRVLHYVDYTWEYRVDSHTRLNYVRILFIIIFN